MSYGPTMNPHPYYHRPFVTELIRMFGDPRPPKKITERQFDYSQKDLEELASKRWHEIQSMSRYLMDLKYVDPLQPELFAYLFPACLIQWRDGIEKRENLPYGECDFYTAVDGGNIYQRMLSKTLRKQVFDWMVKVFMWGVGTIKPDEAEAIGFRNENLEYFHWLFNALGDSTPIIKEVLKELSRASNPGIARYWLTFAAGLCWDFQDVPWVSRWTPEVGGGGPYLLESHAQIFEHGFLEENLEAYTKFLTRENIKAVLERADQQDVLPVEHERIRFCLTRMETKRDSFDIKLEWFIAGLPMGSLKRAGHEIFCYEG